MAACGIECIVLLVLFYYLYKNYGKMNEQDDQEYPPEGSQVHSSDKNTDRKRLYLSNEETASRLRKFEREARTGLPDAELARMAEVSVSSVRFWRAKLGIVHSRGRDRKATIDTAKAMALLGNDLGDVLQRVRESDLDGMWEPPEYLVRLGVNYRKLIEQIAALRDLGYAPEEIAEAHGYTLRTVNQALDVYDRKMRDR